MSSPKTENPKEIMFSEIYIKIEKKMIADHSG